MLLVVVVGKNQARDKVAWNSKEVNPVASVIIKFCLFAGIIK